MSWGRTSRTVSRGSKWLLKLVPFCIVRDGTWGLPPRGDSVLLGCQLSALPYGCTSESPRCEGGHKDELDTVSYSKLQSGRGRKSDGHIAI